MSDTMIDRLYTEHQDLVEFLNKAGEISLANTVDASFRKALLLSAASFFEVCVRNCLTDFFSERSGNDDAIIAFLKNKAIGRQCHSFFTWDARNANTFFGLFGSAFKEFMSSEVKKDATLESSIQAFLELGDLRNTLVHQDYSSFPLEKTVSEIFVLYTQAKIFVDVLPVKMRAYNAKSG